MSIQPDHDLLDSLRAMHYKIECDPAPPTRALQQLYSLIRQRIAELEETHVSTGREGHHAT